MVGIEAGSARSTNTWRPVVRKYTLAACTASSSAILALSGPWAEPESLRFVFLESIYVQGFSYIPFYELVLNQGESLI
jgi:hypothetical protein